MPARAWAAVLLGIAILCSPSWAGAAETVILVHGIASLPLHMSYLESVLEKRGYRVLSLGYPSTEVPIEDAARMVGDRLRKEAEAGGTINLVGHSLGNIVLRKALAEGMPHLGRMVMIAPPNKGSFAAETLKDLGIYYWIFGPAGQELSADNRAFFDSLPVPPCPFGIIAGGKGDGEGYNPLLPGDDDGTVRVEETRLPGASDFVLVNNTHTLLLFDPETARYAARFIAEGRFKESVAESLRLP